MTRISDMLNEEQRHEEKDLERGLKDRHIQLIAIGGAIGVGLFLGSAKAISKAGPALLVTYAIAGLAIFFIMRALGELLIHRPVAGSFATYAEEYVSPWAGYVTGWTYWFTWIVTGMAELTAVGVYVHYWFPDVPQWIPALVTLVVLYSANLIAVKVFGEMEFWFAIIKVFTIVAMLVIGLVIILFGVGDLGKTASFSNLWSHGGFAPMGVVGVILTLQIACFAYTGVELIGVTAGEAQNPEKVLPHATNSVTYRILIFYIGALIVLMSLVPWNELNPNMSPFVTVFEKIGIPAAAGIINFVVITAAASSCNSGIFSTGRMLYTLAQFKQAPASLAKVSMSHVPANAITLSAAVMLVGVALNYVVPEEAFVYVTSVATVGAVWTWGIIVWSHLKYRQAVKRGLATAVFFRMPGAPVANWFVLAFLGLVVVFLGTDPGTRVALFVAPVWFALLTVGYLISKSRADRGNGVLAAEISR
ncbi:amino acid permease [Aromatoleum petrolei]|uniref:Amino acid permease n=1 Tax=Aromatoleum petrolei TaxID=76116 RepID=A0ABX1MMR1_9RHOO|nr:amino acid permease [Aromatoleum petrolei]NMF89058.1 amino acid permease [Aromatoleum petrolei]QTQ38352.1 Amino acid permease [Aromatoleum petrolei]